MARLDEHQIIVALARVDADLASGVVVALGTEAMAAKWLAQMVACALGSDATRALEEADPEAWRYVAAWIRTVD